MALASTWSVDVATLVRRWSPDHGNYSSSASASINDDVIQEFLDAHIGRVNAMLDKNGIAHSAVGDDELELIQSYIYTSTMADLYRKLNMWEAYREVKQDARDLWKEVSDVTNLGDAQGTDSTVHHNVPAEANRAELDENKWGSNFKGW